MQKGKMIIYVEKKNHSAGSQMLEQAAQSDHICSFLGHIPISPEQDQQQPELTLL